MKKKLFSLLLAGVILASSFSSVSATTEEASFKSGITVTKFAQGFIDSVNPDKNLSTGEVIKVYNEDELLSGFCVSLYQEEQPSGYVVIKNTVDGPTISEFATELGMKNIYSELYEGYYHDHAEVSQENATILNHQGNTDKKLYSFGPNEYMISVKNIEKGQTDTQYYDYIGQTLDQTTFEQSKLSAKQLKKQAKEEQKQKREALKTLKQEIKNQQQSVKTDPISTQKDAVNGAVLDAVNEDFQKNPVTLAEVEAAELELEKTIEYIPFPLPQANTNRKYDDGEQVICDYDRFLEIKGETTDSVMLPGVFNYQIYKQKDFTSTIKKFACGVVAMTNMASYYQGNGYGNALKNDSYIETFERLWALSNTKIHKIENGYRIITKGAPDILINRCIGINKNEISLENEKMANNALRVIAVAYKDIEKLPSHIESETIEKELNFVGLIGMMDPPRQGVKEAVDTCKKAGIKIVMITGDHIATAASIAKKLHILDNSSKAMTGAELDKMKQEDLEKKIKDYSVFARVTPEHKVRIIKAWQKNGAVVAMTGDGVNDSPALKNSNIGIAMGKSGTDVAKNAADMILTDDNFVTIVEAVKEGRNIYDNIKKAIHFLIATNIGEIVTIFMGLILGFETPLLALQLLWINMVTDSFPAIALGLEKPDKDIMKRKPINSKKGIFADGLWGKIIIEGLMIGFLTLVVFSIGNKYYGVEVARTMAFMALGMLELIHSFNIKSEGSIFKTGILENKYLMFSLVGGIALQLAVIFIPSIAQIFELVPLSKIQWIITIILSLMPIPIMELQKRQNRKEEKVEYKFQEEV